MTSRSAPEQARGEVLTSPCRCGLCLALLRAAANAERNERARRKMTLMDGGRAPER